MQNRPTLKHQRCQPEKEKEYADINAYYKKGVKEVYYIYYFLF